MKRTLTLWTGWQSKSDSNSFSMKSLHKSVLIALLGMVFMFGTNQNAFAWNLPSDPSCDNGSFVWQNDISYDDCDVYSDVHLCQTSQFTIPTNSYPAAFDGPVTININEYVSWDGYCGRENTGNQPHEQWKVVFLKNGSVAWETSYTADLSTGDMDTEESGALGSHYFANGVDEILLVHWNDWQYGEDNNSCSNSVYPASVCFGYEQASEISMTCPSNVVVTTSAGQNSAIATWNTPAATTTCMVGGDADCSQISNNISGFIFMGEHNNSKYYCSDGDNFTWNQAINYSAAAGGYLVSINNSSENEFVRSVIGADKAWIGYTDANSEGNYHWVSGENSSYSNWKSWAPDGGSSQNYTVIYKSDGRWNDKGSNCHAEFVMEIPCPGSSNPGNVTLTQTAGLPSGSSFAVGTHTMTYQATDDCGNTETCNFTVTVNPGQPATPASVGNFVWSDTNGNGIQDAGEPGVPGVFVMLTDCAGNWKGQTTTGANGEYSFTNVTPGSYKIKFAVPADHTISPTNAGGNTATDSDLNQGWTGFTDCFDLASGQNRTDIDAGFVPQTPAGSLSLVCTDDIVVTAVPGQNTAMVSWTVPTATSTCAGGATLTQTSGPSNNALMAIGTQTVTYGASDACGNYETCSFTVTVQPGVATTPATVGNFVWSDTNGNGIQDAGEPGIPGVFVMLTDCAGNWKGQTTTGANGEYSFTNVTPGSYKIKFVTPADHTVAPTNAGSNDAVDNDVNQGWTGFTDCFDLTSGQNRTDIDAGFVPAGQPGGDLSLTCSNNISVTAAAGQTSAMVSWTAPTATSTCAGGATVNQTAGPTNGSMMAAGTQTVTYTATDNCGNTETCSFTVTVTAGPGGNNPATVGNFVWSDTNGNGIQDAGEPGIPGVFVMLTDCAGNWKGQTTTGANGEYSFTNVTPGSYKIKFVAPADHSISPTNAGSNDATDSDVNQGWTGFTDCFDLTSGQNRTDIDAGFVPTGQPGGDLSLTCSNDISVTAPAGQGTAMVSWTVPTATSTCAGGATLTQTNGPANNAPMAIGTQTVSYSASDNCGNYETCSFTVTVTQGQPVTPGSVGDYVWSDTNGNGIQDAGEPGLEGVFVMLTDCAGNWKGQTTTDASGAYHFANVAPGSYKVKFVGPLGSTPAPTNAGSNGATDSDMNQGWTGFTDCFDVASGQDITDIDAGFVGVTPTGVLTMNCNNNMNVSAPDASGATVTWTAPTATSTCTTGTVSVSQTSGPTSGSMLTVGSHTVTYTATDGCGNTETCSFTITVSYSGPAVCTTRTISNVTHCNSSSQGTFWAEDLVYGMSGVGHNYHLISGGTFTEYEDGTARFTGTVANNGNSNAKFAFDYTLSGKTASNNNPHDAYCFSESKSDWYYYTSMTGTLTGVGALAGAQINSAYNMYLPQIGTGANMHQNVFGFASWVTLDVVSQPNNSNYSLDDYGNANGDFNFNLSGDPSTCSPVVATCASREVWDAYQCDVDQDFGFFAIDFINGLGYSAKKDHYEEKGYSTFVEYTDGTAHLSMKVRNNCIPNIKFQIELDFSGRTFNTPSDASDNAYGCYNVDNSDWYYYTNVTGTISGLHDMEGAVINVWNVMHPFQIGSGAALWGDWNDFGGTTWLGYNVVQQPDQYYYLNNGGEMDVNFRMSGNATACGGSDYTNSTARVMDLALEQDEYVSDLTWQNNTGDVNEYFVIERSADGTSYTAIAQVESEVTAQNVTSSYTYKDAEPLVGKNFYRVVAITNNGQKIISNKAQAIFGDRTEVTLFPNPAGEFFMIDLLPYKGAEATVTITDQIGQVVKTISLDEVDAAPLRVSLDKFINGYYNVQVQTTDGHTVSKKLVVARMY